MVVAQLLLALESLLLLLPPVFVAQACPHSGSQYWLLSLQLANDAHYARWEKIQHLMKDFAA